MELIEDLNRILTGSKRKDISPMDYSFPVFRLRGITSVMVDDAQGRGEVSELEMLLGTVIADCIRVNDIPTLLVLGVPLGVIESLRGRGAIEIVRWISAEKIPIILDRKTELYLDQRSESVRYAYVLERLSGKFLRFNGEDKAALLRHLDIVRSPKGASGKSILLAIKLLRSGVSPVIAEIASGIRPSYMNQIISELQQSGVRVETGGHIKRSMTVLVDKRAVSRAVTLFLMFYEALTTEAREVEVDFEAMATAYHWTERIWKKTMLTPLTVSINDAFLIARSLREGEKSVELAECRCGAAYAVVSRQRFMAKCHVCNERIVSMFDVDTMSA